MEVDLDPIKKKYKDIEWSLEMAGEPPIRCLVGKKGDLYKAIVVPPHEFFTFAGKPWPKTAAKEIARLIHEAE